MVGVGGIIRNDVGTPILSYSGPVGFSSANAAELMAIRPGLREAKRLSFHNLIIEGDSFCAILWASRAVKAPWKVAGVVGEIFYLFNSIQVSFSHIGRSANSKADSLAKEGASSTALRVIVYSL